MLRLDEYLKGNGIAAMRLTPMSVMSYTPVLNLKSDQARAECMAQLTVWLGDLINWFKVAAKPEPSEIGQIAYHALEKFGDLSMPDFWVFCKYAKGGGMVVDGITRKFELPYNRLDAVVIYDWLAIYREGKIEAREKLHAADKAAKAQPFEWTADHRAAFDLFMMELRGSMNQPKEVDHAAIDRERSARREQMISIAMNDLHGATLDELSNMIPHVAGDLILSEAVNRMISARKGAGE